MLDFTGPITISGPITITGPDHTAQLNRIEQSLLTILPLTQLQEKQMARLQEKIDAIKAEVAEARTVNQSARALLDRLFALVQDNIDDPAELQEVLDALKSEREALAANVSKNTLAETEPAPEAPDEE